MTSYDTVRVSTQNTAVYLKMFCHHPFRTRYHVISRSICRCLPPGALCWNYNEMSPKTFSSVALRRPQQFTQLALPGGLQMDRRQAATVSNKYIGCCVTLEMQQRQSAYSERLAKYIRYKRSNIQEDWRLYQHRKPNVYGTAATVTADCRMCLSPQLNVQLGTVSLPAVRCAPHPYTK